MGDKDTLEKVQEKAVKMVAGLKSKTYKEKCQELGLDTLEARREEQDMALVYNLLNGKDASDLFERDDENVRPRTRQGGGALGLVAQHAKTDQRKYSFAVRTVNAWNHLPDEVKKAPNKELFKERMKAFNK